MDKYNLSGKRKPFIVVGEKLYVIIFYSILTKLFIIQENQRFL